MSHFLLVHGAWHGAWCFEKITALLEAGGHQVTAVDLPGHGSRRESDPIEQQNLKSCAKGVADVLEKQSGPVILAAHSWGGMCITQAAAMCPDKIQKLVYIAAGLPRDGQSINNPDDGSAINPCDWVGISREGKVSRLVKNEKAVELIDEDYVMDLLYADVDEAEARNACRRLTPEAVACLYDRVELNAEVDRIPRYYIRTLYDKAITPEYQDAMIANSPCKKVYTMKTGHSPFLAQPERLVQILDEIAED